MTIKATIALRLFFCTVVILALESSALAQTKSKEQERPLKLKTELVELRVVITGKNGQLIDGLRKEDFELMENDSLRDIAFFSANNLDPGQANDARDALSSGRTIILFIDNLHLSTASFLRVKQAIREFININLGERDMAAILTSAGTLGLLQQFTRDRRVLLFAVEKLPLWIQGKSDSRFTPYLAALIERNDREALRMAAQILREEEVVIPEEQYIRYRARQVLHEAAWKRKATLSMLEAAARQMADLPGQRMIFFLSDGFSLFDAFGSVDTFDLNRATSSAAQSGVVIYTHSARGLESFKAFGQEELENGLNSLARDTGGQPYFNSNDIKGALQKAIADNRFYYTLSYYPLEGEEKKFRRITVRIKGHPEYKVRAPKGYVIAQAAMGKAAAAPRRRLFQAIAAPLPSIGLGITTSSQFLLNEADGTQVSIFTQLDGKSLDYIEDGPRHRFAVQLVAVIYDTNGKPIKTVENDFKGVVRAGALEQARQSGHDFEQRVSLKPGLYQVRIGAREPSTGQIGTAMAWVEVPDFKRGRLTLSNLFIAAGDPLGKIPRADEFKSAQAVRKLNMSNGLAYYLEIYDASSPPETLMMRIQIRHNQESPISGEWKPLSQYLIGKTSKAIKIASQIKLADFEPGLYELQIEVKDPKSGRTAQRAVLIEMEPPATR